jgi:fluoride exporter
VCVAGDAVLSGAAGLNLPGELVTESGANDLQKYLFIAIGGGLGSIARYAVGVGVSDRLGIRFPYGTLIVNISACLLIGFSLEVLNRHTNFNPALRYLIPIGFIGAYSTFSTFEWEIFSSLRSGAFWVAILYMAASVVFGLISVALGSSLGRAVS